jgi:hypothetical protein
MDDTSSVTTKASNVGFLKQGFLEKALQKVTKYLQTEENQKWLQVFILDPIISHIFQRLFPYVLLFSILFVILIIFVSYTFYIVFVNIPKHSGMQILGASV